MLAHKVTRDLNVNMYKVQAKSDPIDQYFPIFLPIPISQYDLAFKHIVVVP